MLAEKEMIKYCFTFNHINYLWYLRILQRKQSQAVADLDEQDFGDSIIEVFSSQTILQTGPGARGSSTDINIVNHSFQITQ